MAEKLTSKILRDLERRWRLDRFKNCINGIGMPD